MKVAEQWGELGADARKWESLRYGIYAKLDKEIAPFTLPFIKLDEVDSVEMEAVIKKRIEGRLWREMTPAEAGSVKCMSREFIARDSDGKARSVADLSHLSDHYDGMITKSEGLERFCSSRTIVMDIRPLTVRELAISTSNCHTCGEQNL
jgi:hypothetical protein